MRLLAFRKRLAGVKLERRTSMELKIGSKIAELRKAKGMTQEQLALALGISAPAVSK